MTKTKEKKVRHLLDRYNSKGKYKEIGKKDHIYIH